MWQARLVTAIIALSICDYLSAPYGVEGRNAINFLRSSDYHNYCNLLEIDGQYIIDVVCRLGNGEEDFICDEYEGGLWKT